MQYLLKQNYEKSCFDDIEVEVFTQILKYYKYDFDNEDIIAFKCDDNNRYAKIWKGGNLVSTFLPYRIAIKHVGFPNE